MSGVITDPDQVTSGWLTAILREKGLLSGEVTHIERKPALAGNSIIVPLEVRYSTATSAPSALMLKLPRGPDDDMREVEFYTAAASDTLPVIRCFDAVYSAELQRFHLLMEDLSATHTFHPPSFLPPTHENAVRIVNALADLHAHWWANLRGLGTRPTADSVTDELAEDQQRFAAFVDFLGDRLSPTRRAIFAQVFEKFPPLRITQLLNTPLTLIHDDPHAGNFLYPRDPQKDTLRIIDWKSWSVNPGVSDLAHMMAVFWFPERRKPLEKELLRQYCKRLSERGVHYSEAQCWHDYRLCVISYLPYPVWQWSMGMPDFIWWHNLERITLAFHDLDCAELLA